MGCARKIGFDKAKELVDSNTERLVGEMLTLLEAVVPSDRQAESSKAMVKQMIWKFNRNVKQGFEESVNEEGN